MSILNFSAESISLLLPLTERTAEREETRKRSVLPWKPGVHILSVERGISTALMWNPAAAAAQDLSLSPSGSHQEVLSRETPCGRHMRETRAPSMCVCVSTINTSHSLQAAAEPATRSCHPQFTQRDSAHVRKWICASRNAGDFLLGTESPRALKTRFKASGNEFNQWVCFLSL